MPQQLGDSAQSTQHFKARRTTIVFPIVILVAFALALLFPAPAAALLPGVNIVLGVIMFGMGLTLEGKDFVLVAKRPLAVLIGVVAQFVIMPLVAVGLVHAFNLSAAIAAGVILVGCAPGGTSSNVISYLARGDVALSVTMTSISTLLAPILTPLLTQWLAGAYLPVDPYAMALSIVKIVFVPVVAGLVLRKLCAGLVVKFLPVLPWISVLGISYVLAAVVGNSRDKILSAALILVVVVALHNLAGYGLGYLAGRLTGRGERASRTTGIEVGMQNSGLAASLAVTHLDSVSALPGAIFSVWHNLSGGILAAIWSSKEPKD